MRFLRIGHSTTLKSFLKRIRFKEGIDILILHFQSYVRRLKQVYVTNLGTINKKNAFFSMKDSKASGKDGYPTTFFHKQWDVIKESEVKVFYDVYNENFDLNIIN